MQHIKKVLTSTNRLIDDLRYFVLSCQGRQTCLVYDIWKIVGTLGNIASMWKRCILNFHSGTGGKCIRMIVDHFKVIWSLRLFFGGGHMKTYVNALGHLRLERSKHSRLIDVHEFHYHHSRMHLFHKDKMLPRLTTFFTF